MLFAESRKGSRQIGLFAERLNLCHEPSFVAHGKLNGSGQQPSQNVQFVVRPSLCESLISWLTTKTSKAVSINLCWEDGFLTHGKDVWCCVSDVCREPRPWLKTKKPFAVRRSFGSRQTVPHTRQPLKKLVVGTCKHPWLAVLFILGLN
jgi:hypothetical protein